MFRATESFSVRITAGLAFLFFAATAHAQNMHSTQLLPAASRGSTAGMAMFRCAFETEIALVPYKLTFAEAACGGVPSSAPAADLCQSATRLVTDCEAAADQVAAELLSVGKRGEIIARARASVLEILQNDNACSAWFRELDFDTAGTFRTAHFVIEEKGQRYVLGFRLAGQGELFKHPWVASAIENAGRNSTIWLNANGAFFNGSSVLSERDIDGGLIRPVGMHVLRVDWYRGNTPEAQITTLLHELGHIVGRIPEDNDNTDGESARNTAEVLRHCRTEVRAAAAKNHRGER